MLVVAMNRAQKVVISITAVVLIIAAIHPIRTFNRVTGITESDYRAVVAFGFFIVLLAVTLYFVLADERRTPPAAGASGDGFKKS